MGATVAVTARGRQAGRFAALVDGDHPAGADRLGELADLVAALRALPGVPDPAFRDELRARVVAAAMRERTAALAAPSPAAGRRSGQRPAGDEHERVAGGRPRRLAAAMRPAFVGGLAAAVAATGVAVGASQSLSHDQTAAAKHTVEQRRQVVTGVTATEGKTHLASARRRLEELAAVLRGADAQRHLSPETSTTVHQLLRAWASEAAAGSSALLTEARRGSSEASRALVDFTDDQSTDFRKVLADLPDVRLRTLAGTALSFMAKVDIALGVPPPAAPAQPVGPTSTLSAPATTGSAPAAPTGTPATAHAPTSSSSPTGAAPTSPGASSASQPGVRAVPTAATPTTRATPTRTAVPPIAQLPPLPLPTSIPPLASPLTGTASQGGSGTP